MASGQKQLARSVLLTFSTCHAPPEFEYPERRILLESKGTDTPTPSIKIGRTSKRFQELGAKENNLFFDSPVMSRDHAELLVDWYHKKVFIKDTSSLHGTHLNNSRLRSDEKRELAHGDILKFGIDIQRSTETFPPCTVEVQWEWNPAPHSPEKINNRPAFQVPDDYDTSDDDDDESDVRATVEKIRKIEQYRSIRSFGNMPSIDLTRESPKPGPVEGRSVIVIDDDVPKAATPEVVVSEVTVSNVPAIATSSQPTSDAVLDIDAPHEDDPQMYDHPLRPLDLDSDSDNELVDEALPPYDDDVSSQSDSSAEEDICLSDSLSGSDSEEDQSNDEQDINDSDSEQDASGDEEDIESPMDYDMNDNDSVDDEYESQVDEPTWEIPTTTLEQSVYGKVANVPIPQVPSQHITNLPVFPNISVLSSTSTLPRTPWTQLPQQGAEELKLPPLLGQRNFPDLLTAQPSDINSSHRPMLYVPPPMPLERNPWLPQNDGPSAEDLGQMTGKPEYFAAREHNKAKMEREEVREPSPEPIQSVAATKATDDNTTTQPSSTPVEAPKSTQIPQSAWMTPGNRFINSPQEPPLLLRKASPEYDMTSAYQFQQSKLQASTMPTSIPHVAVDSIQAPVKELAKSPKRKADDISSLLPEEQAVEVSASATEQPNGETSQSATPTGEAAVANVASNDIIVSTNTKTEQPPAKRLRFLPSWKGVGTFGAGISAGGIMLASMLAMSAPNL
ncbi:hypothetical protein CkaCkLH20_00191 [Colletotrichum karsti]|uniref:FHA domain-containing protein n=1 Tax=Colletotrichum karsti TaxID=1095194 RepID=A0A9P6IG46_9PEZI|nr:uncharacterized protein CkaCkLH20_00191 [Colletotrichum karsti]KAF9882155.1 hypothetical protein CkaCkLH20_00191 [Colletotrichum karsti]